MSYNIQKEEVTVYRLRQSKTSDGWADITIDGSGKQVRVSVSSDYGNWSYYWGACGNNYKSFLIGLDMHYVAGKTINDNYFDLERTLKGIRSEILEHRREEELTKDEARKFKASKFDYATFSGTFEKRNDKALISH